MIRTVPLATPEDTEALGAGLGGALRAAVPDRLCVIWLRGELGAGKTTLVRGLLRSLGHEGRVKSPTYTLVEPYQLAGRPLLHCDLYRLTDPGELDYLGLTELLEEAAVLLVEWPERGGRGLPRPDLELVLEHQPEGRLGHLQALTATGTALLEALAAGSGVE